MERWLRLVVVGAMFSFGLVTVAQEGNLDALAASLGSQAQQTGKKTLAVVDFVDLQGNVTELGRYLSEEVSDALASSGKGIEVVERTQLHTLMQEYKLDATGLVDPSTTQRLGKISGASAIITGTITPFGDTIHLAAKILDTQTARIIGAARTSIPRTKAIDELLASGIGTSNAARAVPASPVARPAGGVPAAPGGGSGAYSAIKAEAEGLVFSVMKCEGEGSFLTCTLLVSNTTSRDRQLEVGDVHAGFGPFGPSRYRSATTTAVDSNGNEFNLAGIQFGSGEQRRDYSSSILSPGVPVKLILQFRDVPESTSKLSAVKVGCIVSSPGTRSATGMAFGGGTQGADTFIFGILLRNLPVMR